MFVDSSNDYIAGDTPIYQDSTFLTEDTPNGTNSDKPNYVKTMEKQLPFTTTHTMAQRLQRISLKKQRLPTSISALVDLKFMQLQPHDTVNVTNERLGFSSKIFEVLSMEMVVQDSEDVPTMAVGLVLRETASSVYDFATSDYQTPLASGSAVASGTFQIAAPTNLSVASNTEVNDVYNTRVVVASWTNSASSLVSGTEVQFKRNSASAYSSMIAGRGVTSLSVGGLEVGQVFNFRIRHFGLSGTQSDFTSVVNHTVSGSVVSVSSLDNSNTTKADVGLDNVDNESSATIRGQDTSGNHTGQIGGVDNADIRTGAERARTVINSDNRFTGDFFFDNTVLTGLSSKSAIERAIAGLDTSGDVSRAVPQAQLTNVVTASVNQQAFVWSEISNAGYVPTATTFTFNITWKDGNGTTVATSRWVATRDTTNDHVDNSGITNNVTGSGVTSSVSGGDSTFMTVTFTKGGTQCAVSASLVTFTGFNFKSQ